MDEISSLLKEAKPLYNKRKKDAFRAKIVLCAMLPMFLFSGYVGNNFYTAQSYVALSSDSVVSQMGMPTDEFGLLKVY